MIRPTKLLTTTKFVLWWNNEFYNGDSRIGEPRNGAIFTYAKMMAAAPERRMFVPCDEKGNVLTEPFAVHNHSSGLIGMNADKMREADEISAYNRAKERVLFSGWVEDGINEVMHEKEHWLKFGKKGVSVNGELSLEALEDLVGKVPLIPNENFWEEAGL